MPGFLLAKREKREEGKTLLMARSKAPAKAPPGKRKEKTQREEEGLERRESFLILSYIIKN